jgi:ribosomal protein S18 acetylase RimI-like enzyme
MTDPIARAIAHFDAEEYRDALLAFEERWHAERSDVLRACIQLANALNQLRLGLVTSPRRLLESAERLLAPCRLLESAERLLAPYADPYEGIDLVALRGYVGAVRAVIPEGLETGAGSVPWDAVPRLKIGRAPPTPAVVIEQGAPGDFADLRGFVAAATREAFDHPDLTDEQRAENQWVADIAPGTYERSLADPERRVFVARVAGTSAGFVIVDRGAAGCPEIDWLIVAPEYHGRGVAQALMGAALAWLGDETDIRLGVIHYNARALAFYRKYGFVDTRRVSGSHRIPRRLLVRPRSRAGEGAP